MDIEGVIFDLDGTLVHTIEDLGDAANAVLLRNGLKTHTTEEFIGWIGNGAKKFIEQCMGGAKDPEHLEACVAEFKEIYGQNLHNRSHVYDGIFAVLDAYDEKGIPMSVLSNKPHHLTVKVVEHQLPERAFKAVFGQRDQVPRKPDPAAALEIAAIMGLQPEKILFVGDSMGDMNTARAAGMIPVGVKWGYGMPELDGSDRGMILDEPLQLIELIKNTK